MLDVYVFAISKFAKIISGYLEDDPRYKFRGYILNHEYINSSSAYDQPLFAYEESIDLLRNSTVLNCVGYGKMLTVRKKIDDMLANDGIKSLCYIHPSNNIMSGIEVGDNCIIMPYTYIGQDVKIGDGNIFWSGSHIEHDVNIGNYNFFAAQSLLLGNVNVQDHCFVGGNATIKNGVNVSSYTLVGAGAYINHDTDEYGVYVPERTIKIQNKSSMEINLQ